MQCATSKDFGIAATLALSLLATSAAVASEGLPDGLFDAVDSHLMTVPEATSVAFGEPSVRQRFVSMDIAHLDRIQRIAASRSEQSILHLNLFDDATFVGIVDSTAPTFSGGYSLSGRMAGRPRSSITIVVNGDTVAGSVRDMDGTYYIRSAGNGLYAISEVDASNLTFSCETVE